MNSNITPQFLAEKTWDLYQTHGVPFEVSFEILKENKLTLDQELLNQLISEHQQTSQTISSGQFKAGVGSVTERTKALHTVTHILHKTLKDIFGDQAKQIGSSITDEKARFDISVSAVEISDQIIKQIAEEINHKIKLDLKMSAKEMNLEEAKKSGAIRLFGEKYADLVTIYTLENEEGEVYSKEFCSGPHISNTKSIKTFKILKKKSIGNGQTRIEFDVELN